MAKAQAATAGLNDLQMTFRGDLIGPDHPAYDTARRVYNGMIDRRPALIARCVDVADVLEALKFARASGLEVSVRGGGHNGAGLAVGDDGLTIDLSRMKGIHVDERSARIRVEPGCSQGDVDHATHPFGLAVPAGTVSTTGIAGLALGGGQGYLTRRWGLTIDNLVEADVVLADGRLVRASEHENADLFFGLRGGGGNFGIVTSFLFQAHPVSSVVAGPMIWPIDRTDDILSWYREYHPKAPTTNYGFPAILRVPPVPIFPSEHHGKPACAIVWCFSGPTPEGIHEIEAIRKALPPAMIDAVGPMPFPMLQKMFDPLLPPGMQWYWKGHFVDSIPDETFEIHRRYGMNNPSALSTMHLYPVDGYCSQVPEHATAFACRDAKWSMVIVGIDPDPSKARAITDWTRSYWSDLRPYAMGGAYVNFMMDEGVDPVKATYRGNYELLRKVKEKYDPENFFRRNQNIKPGHEG